MLAQTLQDLVVVPDGRGLIFACSKVALQLEGRNNKAQLETDKEEGCRSPGLQQAGEKPSNDVSVTTDRGSASNCLHRRVWRPKAASLAPRPQEALSKGFAR